MRVVVGTEEEHDDSDAHGAVAVAGDDDAPDDADEHDDGAAADDDCCDGNYCKDSDLLEAMDSPDHYCGFRKTTQHCRRCCGVRFGSVGVTTQSHLNGIQLEGHSPHNQFQPI